MSYSAIFKNGELGSIPLHRNRLVSCFIYTKKCMLSFQLNLQYISTIISFFAMTSRYLILIYRLFIDFHFIYASTFNQIQLCFSTLVKKLYLLKFRGDGTDEYKNGDICSLQSQICTQSKTHEMGWMSITKGYT